MYVLNIINMLIKPFNHGDHQINEFEFSLAWSCVSLTRSTTLSEWKILRFDKTKVNYFQILLIWF